MRAWACARVDVVGDQSRYICKMFYVPHVLYTTSASACMIVVVFLLH